MATETGVLIQFDVRGQEIVEIEMPMRGGDCDITGDLSLARCLPRCPLSHFLEQRSELYWNPVLLRLLIKVLTAEQVSSATTRGSTT